MSEYSSDLQLAYGYLQQRQYYEAREILLPIIRKDPDNADAWWLLANAQSDPKSSRDALQIVLRLKPNHAPARAMLDRLDATFAPGSDPVISSSDVPFPDVPNPFSQPASPNAPLPLDELLRSATPGQSVSKSTMNAPFTETTGLGAPSVSGYAPPIVVPRNSNRGLRILLIASGLVICLCLACVALGSAGFTRMLGDPTFQAALGTVGAVFSLPETLPAVAVDMGAIKAGATLEESIGVMQYQAYTYNSAKGESVTITVAPRGARGTRDFALLLGLYDAAGKRVAGNGLFDSIATSAPRNQSQSAAMQPELKYTFADEGAYTILIAGLANNSDYSLQVESSRK